METDQRWSDPSIARVVSTDNEERSFVVSKEEKRSRLEKAFSIKLLPDHQYAEPEVMVIAWSYMLG
jgi:hypothetical protein